MAAIILSIVYRQIQHLTDVVRALTEAGKYVLTRQKEKVRYDVVRTLSKSSHYKDEIIQMGLHHTNPCKHPMRLVSVVWGKTWYRYLTNVLDPELLSAQEVCDLYRRRWYNTPSISKHNKV